MGILRLAAARFSPVDLLNLSFLAVLAVLLAASGNGAPEGRSLALAYAGLALLVVLAAWVRRRAVPGRRILLLAYPVLFLFAVFETFHLLLPHVNTARYDAAMAAADRFLFGVDPCAWIARFARPAITELMALCYLLYFPMPLVLLVRIYRRGKLRLLAGCMTAYLLTYYGAYLCYFLLPVAGPRFHGPPPGGVHLEGLWLAEPIRRFIDLLEPNKFDCFPSLHAAVTLLTVVLARRYDRCLLLLFLPLSAGILVSLLYCRYHYFVDVAAGLAWAAVAGGAAERMYRRVHRSTVPHFGRRIP